MTTDRPSRPRLDRMTDDDLDRLRDRLATAEARAAELERERDDLQHNLAQRAYTAPDADWDTILTSLDARIRDAVDRADRADRALRACARYRAETQWLRDRLKYACDRADATDGYAAELKYRLADAEKRARTAEAALDRVRATVNDLCTEPHPTHDHVCPDDVRRYVLVALDGPAQPAPQS